MQYDPIKKGLGSFFNRKTWLRKLFYHLLDLLLLRSWHIRKEIRKWASTQNIAELSVLDAGSGFGQYVYYMASRHPNWNILGLDVKAEQIDDCNRFFAKTKYNNVKFREADLTQLKAKEQYNFILCVDVMEHIEADVLVLGNFYNALKPGGMLLISTPSDQGGSDVHHHNENYNNDGSQSFIDEHVRDGYGMEEMKHKLREAGFSQTMMHYQYGKPGKISWRFSMKYPILMLNRSRWFFVVLPVYYLIWLPFMLLFNFLDLNGKHNSGTGLVVKALK